MVTQQRAQGAVNATAPNPVANREFVAAVGHALGRPSLVPTPAFALRALLGEMADSLVLGGQRVVPARALAEGFHFRYEDVGRALGAILGSKATRK
jgi:NAD dependent epimerase/dehydratase family enzyme